MASQHVRSMKRVSARGMVSLLVRTRPRDATLQWLCAGVSRFQHATLPVVQFLPLNHNQRRWYAISCGCTKVASLVCGR